ncbi:hypothetical protein HK104_002859 [Borealophlyctis nickersoniae]|nr:hypothetical protein HK104_002859 [Borealophlyctis nickersoniae]
MDNRHPSAPTYWNRYVVLPFKQALRAGTSPSKLALTISLGITLGIFPILGVTTFLCFLAAWRWSLNIPLIQAVNLIMTPVDIALSIPFMRMGEKMLGRDPLPLSPAELLHKIREEGFAEGAALAAVGLGCAVFGWALVVGPLTAAIYYPLKPVLIKVMAKKESKPVDEFEEPLLARGGRASVRSSRY